MNMNYNSKFYCRKFLYIIEYMNIKKSSNKEYMPLPNFCISIPTKSLDAPALNYDNVDLGY